jgi:DNA-binding GntR family transcriptional regulator
MKTPTISNNQLLRTQVYEYLRKELKRGNFVPGTYVSIKNISESLGMSRTPVKDALLQLQAEGFVTFLPQRGVMIKELTLKEIENIFEILGALDSRVLLSVFNKIGPKELERMKKINKEMLATFNSERFDKYFDFNSKFHNIYLNFSTNDDLLKLVTSLRQRLFEFNKRDWEKVIELNYEEHETLIEIIEKGDAQEAANFIRDVHCSVNWL